MLPAEVFSEKTAVGSAGGGFFLARKNASVGDRCAIAAEGMPPAAGGMFRLACCVCFVAYLLLAACARGSAPDATVRTTGDVQVYGVYRTHAQFAD